MKLKTIEETSIYNDLKDPEFAVEYLKECLNDGGSGCFLAGLRNVVRVQLGIRELSTLTELNRENLYRVLSENGNPNFATLQTILQSLGLKFSIELDAHSKEAA